MLTFERISFFLLAFSLVSLGYAQEMSSGPHLKNGLLGKFKGVKISLATHSQEISAKGPRIKNQLVSRRQVAKSISNSVTTGQPAVKGPRAKNSKSGRKKMPIVASRAAYQKPKSMKPPKRWIH